MPFTALNMQLKAFLMNTLKELFSIAPQTRFTYASAFYLLNDFTLKNKVARVIRDRHLPEERMEQLLNEKIDNRATFTPLHQQSVKKHKGDESVTEQCIEDNSRLLNAIDKATVVNGFERENTLPEANEKDYQRYKRTRA
jgi:hypothetical protein